MGIEESFHLHPFFLILSISMIFFVTSYFLWKRSNEDGTIHIFPFIIGSFFLIIGTIVSFAEDSKYKTLSSDEARVYVNEKQVRCVNVNGIEFPVAVNGAEFDVDGISVFNWVGDNENDSICYIYLQEEEGFFFKESFFKRDGIRIQITDYKVFQYEFEATLNESIVGAKKLTQ